MNLAPSLPTDVTLELAPLDVPLRVECTGVAHDAIVAACRGWEGRGGPSDGLRLRVERSPGLSGTGDVAIDVSHGRMTVQGHGVAGQAELDRGFAHCAVSAQYAEDPDRLRQEVLEPLVLMTLSHRDRTPLHASAFLVDDLVVLLAGRAGAGKSCLARAADSAGFQVLSDDTVFVQLAPRLTVWGWPTVVHLLARDAPGSAGPTRVRNGKVKQVVPLRSASPRAIACNRAVLCFLSQSSGKPTLRPMSPAAADERLWPLDEGFDLLPGPIAKAAARLSAGGAWDLRLSKDPAEAVRLLAASVPRLRKTAAFMPA